LIRVINEGGKRRIDTLRLSFVEDTVQIVRLSASHQQRALDQPPQHSIAIFRFDRLPLFFLNCFSEAFGADQKALRAMAAAIFHLAVNRSDKD